MITDSLRDVVELYKKFENLFKQMVVFSENLLHKTCWNNENIENDEKDFSTACFL